MSRFVIDVLRALARPDLEEPRRSELRDLLRDRAPDADWGSWLLLVHRHRVAGLVSRNLQRYPELRDARGKKGVPAGSLLEPQRLYNAERNEALARELAAILRHMRRHGIEVVPRKGIALTEVYGDLSVRQVRDTDVMVRPAELDMFVAQMHELGYAFGHAAGRGRTITPLAPVEEAAWRASMGSIPHLWRPTSNPYIGVFKVDTRLDLLDAPSTKSVPTVDMIDRAQPRSFLGVSCLMIDSVDALLDLCVHVHREAHSPEKVDQGLAWLLSRFVDVCVAARHAGPQAADELRRRSEQYDVASEVDFALWFANELLPDIVPPPLVAATAPARGERPCECGEHVIIW